MSGTLERSSGRLETQALAIESELEPSNVLGTNGNEEKEEPVVLVHVLDVELVVLVLVVDVVQLMVVLVVQLVVDVDVEDPPDAGSGR